MDSAEVARYWWATEGGLKEESRMKRVLGESDGPVGCRGSVGRRLVGWIVLRTRNLEPEDWKSLRADAI